MRGPSTSPGQLDKFRAYLLRDLGLSARTAQSYARIVARYSRSPLDPTGWLLSIRHRRSPPTQTDAVYGRALRAWLRFRGEDPSTVAPPRVNRRQHRTRGALGDDAVEALLIAAREEAEPARTIVPILFYSAARVSELCSLRSSDVQYDGKTVWLRIRHGKGDKPRRVPLPRAGWAIIARYVKGWRRGRGGTWLFPGRSGGHYSAAAAQAALRRVRVRAGLPATVTAHVLRHTAATRMHGRGVPVNDIAAILGHSNPRTTDIYLHPDERSLRRATAALDSVGE